MKRRCILLLMLLGIFTPAGVVMVAARIVDHHGLDVETAGPERCLACHDGSMATNITVCSVGCLKSQRSDHPVYLPYPPAENSQSFNSPAYVEAQGIRLHNGEISCSSCHDLSSQTRYHLRIKNDGSSLCKACHRI